MEYCYVKSRSYCMLSSPICRSNIARPMRSTCGQLQNCIVKSMRRKARKNKHASHRPASCMMIALFLESGTSGGGLICLWLLANVWTIRIRVGPAHPLRVFCLASCVIISNLYSFLKKLITLTGMQSFLIRIASTRKLRIEHVDSASCHLKIEVRG